MPAMRCRNTKGRFTKCRSGGRLAGASADAHVTGGATLVRELRAVARGAIRYNDEQRRIMPHDYAAAMHLVRKPATADRTGHTAYLRHPGGQFLLKFRRRHDEWLLETMEAHPRGHFGSTDWRPVLISAAGKPE